MKYKIFFLIFALFSIISVAQNNIEKSSVIENIDGKEYYIHTVKKGETVYGICKLYGITDKELVEENPEIFDGLKPGQKLKIIKKYKKPAKSKDFIYFNVEKGQTIYSITKKYHITEEELYHYNPELKNGLKVGQEVRIKKKMNAVLKKPVIVSPENRYIKHKVKKKETLYSISKKYDVSIDDILKANIEVKESGLKKGMILNIPTKDFLKQALWQAQQDSIAKDSVLQAQKNQGNTDTTCVKVNFDKNKRLKIALMLPFALDNKTLNIELKSIQTETKKIRPKTKPFFEIYQGILLALNEYKQQGYNIDLYVYDTKKSPYTVKQILKKPEISQLDFIIGPIYTNTFDTALKYKPAKLPLISPLKLVESNINKNKYYIQLTPSKDAVMDKMARHFASLDSARFIVVYDEKDQKSKDNTWIYSERLKHYISKAGKDSAEIIKVRYENKLKDFKKYFNHNKTNIVVIPSENQAFVTDVVTKLNISNKQDSVILFGFKSWMKYNIQIQYFHNLNLSLFVNKVPDYKKHETVEFLNKYRDEYNSEASKYAMIGYDIFKMFVDFDINYAFNPSCLQDFVYKGLIYDVKLYKNDKHFVNNKTFLLRYTKDYRIEMHNR